jgi:hypothetical protein
MPKPNFMKLGMSIMAHMPISTACFINSSNRSVCLHLYHLIVPRQRLSKKRHCGNEYTCNNRRTVGFVVFYMARVVSKESRSVLPIIPCLKYTLCSYANITILKTENKDWDVPNAFAHPTTKKVGADADRRNSKLRGRFTVQHVQHELRVPSRNTKSTHLRDIALIVTSL